jgi:4,5-dihydroxyphthalate decarboxylase
MHVIAMRRAVYERYPWAVMNLLKGFEEAKKRSVERVRDLTASRFPLPWGATLADEATKTFGDDLFPYGLEDNRKTLDAYCRFAHAEGSKERCEGLISPSRARHTSRLPCSQRHACR